MAERTVPVRHSLPVVACVAMLLPLERAVAQGPWSLFLTGGAVGFSSAIEATVEDVNEPDGFKPASTTRIRLGVGRSFSRFEAQVSYGHAKSGVASIDDVTVTFTPAFTLHEFVLQAGYRLFELQNGATGLMRIGPMLQVWEGDLLDDWRTEWGAQAGFAIDASLTSGLTLMADATLGVAGSFFRDDEFDDLNISYERTAIWTRELAVGLRYRF